MSWMFVLGCVVWAIGALICIGIIEEIDYQLTCKGRLHRNDCQTDGFISGMVLAIWTLGYMAILGELGFLP